ncbi:MAG TPA: RtcB family protein [Myxococcales bacterium]
MQLRKIDENRFEIPRTGGMRVPGLIFANEKLLHSIREDPCLEQVCNVAHLPGIVKASLAMPDIHWGYGFPIGGVAAMDEKEGVVSPGGVGYDINCGVRLMTTVLDVEQVRPHIRQVVAQLFRDVPCGVGSHDAIGKLGERSMMKVLEKGAAWAVGEGYGTPDDLSHAEEGGCLRWADPESVSELAIKRGSDEVGTLGSGNHFLEVQEVAEIFDPQVAEAFGLFPGQITVMVHSGSRGLGYQVCDDSLAEMGPAMRKYGIELPDRQLASAPIDSPEGRRYLGAMAAAANFAWANRQIMMVLAQRAMTRSLAISEGDLGARLLYDVCHNIAKRETHSIDGAPRRLLVHRKGATRAFGPGTPELPEAWRSVGQPVLIPGDMGRASYVLVGTERAMSETFGSSCHGAGRVMSRGEAMRRARGRNVHLEMKERGVEVHSRAKKTLAEEMPEAYKDVTDVVGVMHDAGITRKVARLKPIGVIKG